MLECPDIRWPARFQIPKCPNNNFNPFNINIRRISMRYTITLAMAALLLGTLPGVSLAQVNEELGTTTRSR